jgi:hypothetical protein
MHSASGSDGITRLFRRALVAFNSTFTSADPSFADLLPALEGRTYSAASATDRLDYVKVPSRTLLVLPLALIH